jgi:hypothetical protein
MASRPNEVWSCDFIHDRTEYGQRLKMLTVVDEYTRECLEIRVEKRMNGIDVLETFDELFHERGAPSHLRSDNGAEFISKKLANWLDEQGGDAPGTERVGELHSGPCPPCVIVRDQVPLGGVDGEYPDAEVTDGVPDLRHPVGDGQEITDPVGERKLDREVHVTAAICQVVDVIETGAGAEVHGCYPPGLASVYVPMARFAPACRIMTACPDAE